MINIYTKYSLVLFLLPFFYAKHKYYIHFINHIILCIIIMKLCYVLLYAYPGHKTMISKPLFVYVRHLNCYLYKI